MSKQKYKKDTIIKTKKTKTKSTRRDLFNFKYISIIIKVLRNNKYAIKRDNSCNKVKQRKQKRFKVNIVVTINTNI